MRRLIVLLATLLVAGACYDQDPPPELVLVGTVTRTDVDHIVLHVTCGNHDGEDLRFTLVTDHVGVESDRPDPAGSPVVDLPIEKWHPGNDEWVVVRRDDEATLITTFDRPSYRDACGDGPE